MENQVSISTSLFESYLASFKGLTAEQKKNFEIKKEHSFRVVENAEMLSHKLKLGDEDLKIAVAAALYHDIGRFKQLVDHETFDDSKSLDHAELSVQVLKELGLPEDMDQESKDIVYASIQQHNKFEISKKLSERELLHARLLRDADKLDIYNVLTEYYSSKNPVANHTLTWELPKGIAVSPAVVKEVLSGKLVTKKEVKNQLDVKIMQLSWVYDINYRPSFEYILKQRYLEKIYNTLSKNDVNIEIYRKVKVYAENKMLG